MCGGITGQAGTALDITDQTPLPALFFLLLLPLLLSFLLLLNLLLFILLVTDLRACLLLLLLLLHSCLRVFLFLLPLFSSLSSPFVVFTLRGLTTRLIFRPVSETGRSDRGLLAAVKPASVGHCTATSHFAMRLVGWLLACSTFYFQPHARESEGSSDQTTVCAGTL